MKDNFEILSMKEEIELSDEERRKYYKNLREYLLKRKLTNTTPGATIVAPKLKKITEVISNLLVSKFTAKNCETVITGLENIPDEPVIFAHTHQSLLDGFVWMSQLDRHVIILHHQDVNKILLLCQYNTGLVLVKKDDKKNSFNAKLDIMGLLLKGHSVAWFPEGTYCLSPNKLHLPLRYGIIEVAQKTGVPIIPVAHQFTYDYSGKKPMITKIQSKYGRPIYVNINSEMTSKLNEYQESISTLKYEIMEENGVFKRKEIDNMEYVNWIKEIERAIELSNVDQVKERKAIYRSNEDFYQFYPINDIPFDENGEFVELMEVRKLHILEQQQKVQKIQKMIDKLRSENSL